MAGIGRVLSDRKTHASNAGGIRAGKVVAMLQLNLGRDLDLAAQVHKERVTEALDLREQAALAVGIDQWSGLLRVNGEPGPNRLLGVISSALLTPTAQKAI
jgi:hypothetical protein